MSQAVRGQMAIMNRSRPINEAIVDPLLSPHVQYLLSQVNDIKAFATQNGLKPTSNYEHYVDLKRDAVVWLVSACKKDKFESKI